ncbi:hypothetical protein [Pectobacterium phage Mimer]|nr:DNA repliation stage II to III switching protein [Pectobacterium phage Mimer]
MSAHSSLHRTNSLRLNLKLNRVAPEHSTGLSSVRCTFEKTLRPLFNNPDLTDAAFLNMLHNILGAWFKYEDQIFTAGSDSLVDILKAKGYSPNR